MARGYPKKRHPLTGRLTVRIASDEELAALRAQRSPDSPPLATVRLPVSKVKAPAVKESGWNRRRATKQRFPKADAYRAWSLNDEYRSIMADKDSAA